MRKRTFEELHRAQPSLEELKDLKRTPIIVILDNIRSMHNVGSIFRTADALRLESVYLAGFTPIPPRPEIEKTALGATESVPWLQFSKADKAVSAVKKLGYTVQLLEQTTESVDIFTYKPEKPVALILGNEVWGVSEELLPLADGALEIPMLGNKQSLNVSVAMGVAVYTIYSNFINLNL
jgi:tRNA G18 (ribose-2'-O)-methylase SpoU